MIVLVANSGRLEQATVELPKAISLQALDTLRIKLRSTITDKKFSDVAALIYNFSKTANQSEIKAIEAIVEKVDTIDLRLLLCLPIATVFLISTNWIMMNHS